MTVADQILLVRKIREAHAQQNPSLLFGPLAGGNESVRLKLAYRQIAKEIHPDTHPDRKEATEAMALLNGLYELADSQVRSKTYGKAHVVPSTVTIRSKRVYSNVKPYVATDICDVYCGHYDDKSGSTRRAMIKVLRDTRDTDLVDAEARALEAIAAAMEKQPEKIRNAARAYIPSLIEKTRLKLHGSERRANIMTSSSKETASLAAVMKAFPNGVPAAHVAWMLNRMIESVGLVHKAGFVYGGLSPSTFLIKPADHGCKLIDFSYAVREGEKLKAVPSDAISLPPEVEARKPVSFSTDLYAIAGIAIALLKKGFPGRAVHGVLNAATLSQTARYQTAEDMHKSLARALEIVFGSPKFVPFEMPKS